ncbi:MAG: hypothetical protein ACXWC3_02635 [Burkholderiales bacterium]
MNVGVSGSVMANRYNYFDLDPTYRNAFGQPLMRMTFDYKENEHKMGRHAAQSVAVSFVSLCGWRSSCRLILRCRW